MLGRCLTDACLINCKRIAFTAPVSRELKYPPKLMAEWFKRGFDSFRRSQTDLLFFEMRVVVKQNDKRTYNAFQEELFGTELMDFNQVPRTWSAVSKDTEVIKVTLHPHGTEYREVAELLKETASHDYRIKKIERIHNRALYLQYNVKRWQFSRRKTDLPDESIERRLWHGTTADAVTSINYHGFNRSYCGKNESRFGQGVYFAVPSRFALDPRYSRRGQSGLKHVYLAQVLVGRYAKGNRETRVPPPIDKNNPQLLFDSTVNDVQNPTIFVIYNDTQAYPQYLITLK
ncbi:protein mono-ADP-ribosyltransferase PARP15-like [Gigantopelta aegis]|uniref:protein mono-ADP-ribosyltransferase PARP15-like n=1 Tax=Gigantopelta aegis TaxID=1735272 RepID=UPI001B88C56E|nr:protein mono-ADP-ribosyltransferase PARP15-like [Gigantopelta aegis]